ncbi:MAG TPA: hypothetical protein VK530_00730 [Candidatus Acidoferrum sp.]|nr:hypothetical protein [Candidatus Acidoferrum sp.]
MASNSSLIFPPRTNQSILVATNDIRPIKPPVVIRDPWAAAAWIAGITIAVVLIALGVRLWWKRRPAVRPVIVPPHVRAREKLNASLALLNDPRAFCIAVSDAVRVYLEERFRLRAPERTTEEFLRDLQTTTHLNSEQKQVLAAFLEKCDLVKFARFEPNEAALRELHESGLRLVHETQFDPVTAPAAPPSPRPVPAATS